jgi:hypothetical protein
VVSVLERKLILPLYLYCAFSDKDCCFYWPFSYEKLKNKTQITNWIVGNMLQCQKIFGGKEEPCIEVATFRCSFTRSIKDACQSFCLLQLSFSELFIKS